MEDPPAEQGGSANAPSQATGRLQLSCLRSRRRMLPACRRTMIADTPARPSTAKTLEVREAMARAIATPAREPTLEILYSLYRTPHVAAPASAAHGARASETPRPVATPLPPRNLSQTGKQWPRT